MSESVGPSQEQSPTTYTDHALLVSWGIFAQEIGLITALEKVPINQRSQKHKPQAKLIEFLVAILSGCEYLQDISQNGHPLDRDQASARAWGQPAWADYTAVSRTIQACTAETIEALQEAVIRISRPFLNQEINLALQQEGVVIYDGDLTGRSVTKGSSTYQEAAFGWMNGQIRFGYQAAKVSLCSPTYGRLWLSVTPHPGNTISSQQLKDMVRQAEIRTGVWPRRRTELLTQRIEQQRLEWDRLNQRWQHSQALLEASLSKLAETIGQLVQWQKQVANLTTGGQAAEHLEKESRQLSQARDKIGVYQGRLERQVTKVWRTRQVLAKHQQRLILGQQMLKDLEETLLRFEEDNRNNSEPIPIIIRLDAGFGSGENITWLIEMGYDIYTKALNYPLTQTVRKQVNSQTEWQPIANQAEMTAWSDCTLSFCPYPLNVGLAHFHLPGQKEHYTLFIHYGQNAVTTDLTKWFQFYNRRQTIEAGIKEGKYVFQMNHLKVRSLCGLAIQEEFAALAANLIRWATHWLFNRCPTAQAVFNQPQISVKQMVRVGANTSAWVTWQEEDYLLLRFAESSPFAGLQLSFDRGRVVSQLPLPFYKLKFFA